MAVFAFFLIYSPRELWIVSLVMILFVALLLWALHRYVLRAVPQSL